MSEPRFTLPADPIARQRLVARFWAKVDKRGPTECWPWLAARTNKHRGGGYGVFGAGRKTHKAHRVSYILSGKALPDDLDLLHTCDNPPCVNPRHGKPGTNLDNIKDMLAKGRQKRGPSKKLITRYERGEAHHNAKLTQAKVDRIRELYAAGGTSYSKLAADFRLGVTTVFKIVKQITWRKAS